MAKSLTQKKHPEGTPGICIVAVIPMRRAPHEESEMTSQLLFGEYYIIEKVLDKWLRIASMFDLSAGWIDRKFFHESDLETGRESLKNHTVVYGKLAEIEMPDGSSQLITAGSSLYFFDQVKHEFRIGNQKYGIRPLSGELFLSSEKITETALQFMNTPYLWGGRSVFGFDCSGFIQTLFKIHKVAFPRDADQQILAGEVIPTLKNALPGDLAFFCNDKGIVNHVGMVMADGHIIHCSGWVRINHLDEKGIFNRELGIHTHKLKEVRRVMIYD